MDGYGTAPKGLTFPKRTQKSMEASHAKSRAKSAPTRKHEPKPLSVSAPSATSVQRPARYCTFCDEHNHEDSRCFIQHRDKLADYLEHFPDKKPYWDSQIRRYNAKTLAATNPQVVKAAVYCSTCNDDRHDESGCFLHNRDKLAIYLERNPDMKGYWRRRIRRHEARLEELAYEAEEEAKQLAFEKKEQIRHDREKEKYRKKALGIAN
jgi:hypothetical protein